MCILQKKDLTTPPQQFFDLLSEHVEIAELWLGATQSLGNGPAGTSEGIATLMSKRGTAVKVLPEVGVKAVSYQVRELMLKGQLRQAADIVTRPPGRSRPITSKITIAWHPGRYVAVPVERLSTKPTGLPFVVYSTPSSRGLATLQWPDNNIRHLMFITGPCDE